MRAASLAAAFALILPACSSHMEYVRTITPEEHAVLAKGKNNWIGRTTDEVVSAYGAHHVDEPDGLGGHVWTYSSASTSFSMTNPLSGVGSIGGGTVNIPGVGTVTTPSVPVVPPMTGPGSPLDAGDGTRTTVTVRAKFWIGKDGKVYRFSVPKQRY